MGLNTTSEWHQRYQQQARWTLDLRFYLYEEAKIKDGHKVLDVGCGTGVLVAEFEDRGVYYYGLDIDHASLSYASLVTNNQHLIQGDALLIPCDNNVFDLTVCHFLLMWLINPDKCLKEMIRVTKPGGR